MAETEPRHVVVVPWSGEGHVNAMLRLALLLASQKGLLVSFAYPARVHASASMSGPLGSRLPPSLRFHVVQDGLPLSEDAAICAESFRASSSVIVQSLEALLRPEGAMVGPPLPSPDDGDGLFLPSTWPPVCCIISDTFLPATHALAKSLRIPRVEFWTSSATNYNIFLHVPQLLAKGVLPLCKVAGKEWDADTPLIDFIPGLPPCSISQLPREMIQTHDVSQPLVEFLIKAFAPSKEADRILVHSVLDLEKHVYDALQAQGFPIYPIGPIFESKTDADVSRHECLHWLDGQKPSSVVYVAFGTMTGLTSKEMQSMALGLESSKCAFLWVVPKSDLHTICNSNKSFWDDFLMRTVVKGTGFILPRAPQMQVLEHSAVGAFISHCGWNSVLESLWQGVPIVTCERAAEQNCNAKCVVEDWKVGIRMVRTSNDSFTADMVRNSIDEIMGNQEVKTRALRFKQVVRNAVDTHGTSHSNLVSLIDYILHLSVPPGAPHKANFSI